MLCTLYCTCPWLGGMSLPYERNIEALKSFWNKNKNKFHHHQTLTIGWTCKNNKIKSHDGLHESDKE